MKWCTIILVLSYLVIQEFSSKPLDFTILNAKEITQSDAQTTIKGESRINVENTRISADSIKINNKTNDIIAMGNVIINHGKERGAANFVKVNTKKHTVHAKSVQALLKNNYRIAAKNVSVDKEEGIAAYCTLSTCKNSANNKNSPVWDIKAKKVIYDRKNEQIHYENAFLEFHGIPIIALPYFSHPSYKVKRKSGFLYPKLGYSKNLGVIMIPKYYLALADNAEIILKPFIDGKNSILWSEYNAVFKQTNVRFDASYQPKISKKNYTKQSQEEKAEFEKIKEKDYRGHIKGHFDTEISTNCNLFANISAVSDKSYLTLYSFLDHSHDLWISKTNLEESNLGMEYFSKYQHAIIKIGTYQNTRLFNNFYKTPTILPYLEHNIYTAFPKIPGVLYSDFVLLNVDYKNDKKDNRIFWNGGYVHNFQLYDGQLITFNLDLIANLYNLRKYTSDNTLNKKSSDLNRIYPNFSIEYSWPFLVTYKSDTSYALITSPRVKTIFAPQFKKKYQDYIKHSDLVFNYLEADNTNILNEDKTSKMNQINTGNKIIYGVNNILFKSGKNIADFYIFQSYKFNNPVYEIPFETGYSKRLSFLLLGGNIKISDQTIIGTDLSFANDFSSLVRSKVYLKGVIEKLIVSCGTFCGRQYYPEKEKNRFRNLFIKLQYAFSNRIDVKFENIVGIKGKVLKTKFGLQYNDECISTNIGLEYINYKKLDVKPDLRVSFTVFLKGINAFKK